MEQDETDDLGGGPESVDGSSTSSAARVPPYVAYSTFLTLLKELKDNGIPPQLDKSVLKRFAFGVQGQLKMALRSLGMLDGDKPNPRLKAFVDALETDAFGPLLLDVLKEVYPYVFALDLKEATPTMFGDAFKQSGAKGEDGLRKCRSFFVHAAKQAGVEFGPRLASGAVPRSNGSSRRKPKAKVKEAAAGGEAPPPPPPPPPSSADPMLDKLLGKFPEFNPEWSPELQTKWFDSFEKFMSKAKVK